MARLARPRIENIPVVQPGCSKGFDDVGNRVGLRAVDLLALDQ
jgi:hypothetical protein